MFNIKNWFNSKTEQQRIEEYLSDSASLEEIERKQRMISRGEAPWQLRAKHSLAGWA